MPLPGWLIESDVFGRSFEPVKEAIRRQGMAFEVIHARPFLNGVIPELAGHRLRDGDRVIFCGTFPLMRQIQLHHRWVPGGWCNAPEFDCERYYPILGRHLLNHPCRMLTIDEAVGDADPLFREFGRDGRVFVRPCAVQKTFVGRCVDRTEFVDALRSAAYAGGKVLVAAPRRVRREWRLVVSRRAAVAASQYREDGATAVEPGCPTEVRAFAEAVLAATPWEPDPIFMLDVCEAGDDDERAPGFRVLELNSFSCSGLYRCDPDAVVAAAAALASEASPT